MIRIITSAALLTAGICCAPLAEADSGDDVYLEGIHERYYASLHTDAEWLYEAHKICNRHLRGVDDSVLMDMVEADLDVPESVSPEVVGDAEGALGC